MKSKSLQCLAYVLCVLMLIGMVPITAFAEDVNPNSLTVASRTTARLAPGVTETAVVSYDKNGDRVKYWVVNANVKDFDTVKVMANYHDNDNTGVWGKATVIEQANAATEKRGYNVVVSQNAAYYNVTTGQPTGAFVMEGVNINGNSMGNGTEFFAQMDDGTYMIGQRGTFSTYSDHIVEAIGGYRLLVWEGAVVAGLDAVSKYPRSTIGVTADGNVVTMLADGNQKPSSAGLTYAEQAQLMLELGCVAAIELDGGGSATYASKYEGEDDIAVRNNCCDGTVRSVSNTFMIISTAVADGTFDHANITTEYAYYAPHSSINLNVSGVDAGGHAAVIPEGITWALSDDTFGTVADGVFTAGGKTGTVAVNMLLGEDIVGSIDVTLVHPTDVEFSADAKTIPYGRIADMTVNAMYNGAEVFVAPDAFTFTLDNTSAGVMDGFMFEAGSDETITSAILTATYKHTAGLEAVVNISFGKGSEVLFDFEDPTDFKWGTIFDLKDAEARGEYTNGFAETYNGPDVVASNYVAQGIHEDVDLVTAANGKVHSGDYALSYTFDYRQQTEYCNWLYGYLYYWGDPITLLDTANNINGVRLGMWMYIPEEAVGSCARFSYTYTNNTTGAINTAYLYFTYQYVAKGFSKLTSSKIPEAGWAYVSVDMSAISNSYVSTSYYKDAEGTLTRAPETNYAPGFIQWIISSSATGAEKCTFYIDDITLDYSDAVDDRDAPKIENITYANSLMPDAVILNNQTSTESKVDFAAVVEEDVAHNFTSIDASTAKVYIDGQLVTSKYTSITPYRGVFAASAILPNGTHDVTFEIADEQGNYAKITKQITIAAESSYPTVTVTGEKMNGSADILCGEQYNININADKVEAIDTITTTIWLNSASTWALDHMTVAQGFTASYVLDDVACMATISITNNGTSLSGNATLVSIPVYNFMYDGSSGVTAQNQWATQGSAPILTLSWDVKAGAVTYTDGNEVNVLNYVPGFGNVRIDERTELNTSIANLKAVGKEWHYHSVAGIADKAATCTESGYNGRTMCSACNSIIEWGTTVEPTGHDYQLVNEQLVCHCGDIYEGSGLLVTNSGTYYLIAGTPIKNRWMQVGDAWYCFKNDYTPYTGNASISGRMYNFGETGAITEGQWFDVNGYHRYYIGPNYYNSHWGLTIKTIDGVEYGFDENGDTKKGYHYGILAAGDERKLYKFDENGVREVIPPEPDVIMLNNQLRYIVNAELQSGSGLVEVGNKFYYVHGSGALATSTTMYISAEKSNGLGFIGYYEFGADSALIMKDGIVDGSYYINGVKQANVGLVQVNEKYYYVHGNGTLATSTTMYISAAKSNSLGFIGYYEFGADSALIMKNGIVDGSYYINGVKQANVGLVQVNEKYYYVHGSGELATSKTIYISAAKSNSLGFIGYYEFGADSALIIKNGIVDGSYYINGVKQANVGLVQVNEKYYYVHGSGELATSKTIYISAAKSNGLGFIGYYEFGADSTLVMKNGIVDGFYYIDGAKQANLGLVQVDGKYYYVHGNGTLATSTTIYISAAKSNDLGFIGYYDFGADSALMLKNGIVDGFYYIDGLKQTNKGLIEIEGKYYFVRGSGALAVGTYYVPVERNNGLSFVGYYEFDENGAMIIGE